MLKPMPMLRSSLDALLAFSAVAIVAIVVYQIFARAADMSIRWTEELARLVSIWAVFLGIPSLILRRGLIRIEFFFDQLPPRFQRVLLILEFVITAGLLAFLVVLTSKQVLETWNQTSAGLVWPMGIFTIPIALGSLLGLFVMLRMRRDLLTPIGEHEADTEVAKESV
jgi:TRAP-type C4-dicarboxylate transport system permease small subunit